MIQRLNEIHENGKLGTGIFTALQSYNIPWKNENINHMLDMVYYNNHSGEKIAAPIARNVSVDTAANIIYTLYKNNWGKLWDTLDFVYNPIDNYNMTEQMTDDETVFEYGKTTRDTDSRTDTIDRTDTQTLNTTETEDRTNTTTNNTQEQTTHNTTETDTPNLTTTTDNGVYGFNSSTAVDSTTDTERQTGTATHAKTGTETTNNTGTITEATEGENTNSGTITNTADGTETSAGTRTTTDSGTDTHTRNYTLTRTGNIGVTTTQQMIEQERELWIWNYFENTVFPDIDKVLTIGIY